MDVFKTLIHSQPGAVGSTVAVTGGSINGTNIGATTPGTGAFTTLTASGATTVTATTDSSSTSTGALVVTGGAAIAKKTYHGDDVLVVPTSDSSTTIQLSGTVSASEAGIWLKQASPAANNYALTGTATTTHVNVASGGTLRLRVANGNYVALTASSLTVDNVPIVANNSSNAFRITNSQTPASAAATGTAGTICWDANYIYVCTAANTWKRAAIATW